jgi:hypothetical protein
MLMRSIRIYDTIADYRVTTEMGQTGAIGHVSLVRRLATFQPPLRLLHHTNNSGAIPVGTAKRSTSTTSHV